MFVSGLDVMYKTILGKDIQNNHVIFCHWITKHAYFHSLAKYKWHDTWQTKTWSCFGRRKIQSVLSTIICKHKNQCPMGNPFAKTRIILNSFSMFQKMLRNFAFHTSISYLLIASKCILWKSLYCMSYNMTTTLQLF
jgi:hypothetical protein